MNDRSEMAHPREEERLEALHHIQILDTPIEERFERITRLAGKSLDMPICAISCIDLHRQWFKSIQGLDVCETARGVSFCQHTILQNDVIVIPDARFDDRFANNPLVTGDPGIVFYAGAPILSCANLPIATLCVIDREPRCFSADDQDVLREFAKLAERELHTPRANAVEDALIQQVGDAWRSSLIDPLTRFWNHEGIAVVITESVREIDQAAQTPTGIAIIELRGYEQICNRMGFVQGDAYLRRFSRAVLKHLNPADSIGRLRDAEFALVLPDRKSQTELVEAMRTVLEAARSEMPFETDLESIGFGFWIENQSAINPDLLLEKLCDGLDWVRVSQQNTLEICTIDQPSEGHSAA